jgi:hypothetical protein
LFRESKHFLLWDIEKSIQLNERNLRDWPVHTTDQGMDQSLRRVLYGGLYQGGVLILEIYSAIQNTQNFSITCSHKNTTKFCVEFNPLQMTYYLFRAIVWDTGRRRPRFNTHLSAVNFIQSVVCILQEDFSHFFHYLHHP